MNVITGNVIDVQSKPGNAGSAIQGITIATTSSANWMVIGNGLWCEPAATDLRYADPLVGTNKASTNVTNLASTGNLVYGHWSTSAWVSNTNGGTINHTAGI